MVSEFGFMWDGNLGRTSAAKHRIELSNTNKALAYLAPYRAGPKTSKFERSKIDMMLADNIIKLT